MSTPQAGWRFVSALRKSADCVQHLFPGDGLAGTPPVMYEALRSLCPQSIWLCIDRTKRHELPDYAKAGLTPLIDDTVVGRMPASRPVFH